MKVGDLVEKLKQFDPDLEVVYDGGCEIEDPKLYDIEDVNGIKIKTVVNLNF